VSGLSRRAAPITLVSSLYREERSLNPVLFAANGKYLIVTLFNAETKRTLVHLCRRLGLSDRSRADRRLRGRLKPHFADISLAIRTISCRSYRYPATKCSRIRPFQTMRAFSLSLSLSLSHSHCNPENYKGIHVGLQPASKAAHQHALFTPSCDLRNPARPRAAQFRQLHNSSRASNDDGPEVSCSNGRRSTSRNLDKRDKRVSRLIHSYEMKFEVKTRSRYSVTYRFSSYELPHYRACSGIIVDKTEKSSAITKALACYVIIC